MLPFPQICELPQPSPWRCSCTCFPRRAASPSSTPAAASLRASCIVLTLLPRKPLTSISILSIGAICPNGLYAPNQGICFGREWGGQIGRVSKALSAHDLGFGVRDRPRLKPCYDFIPIASHTVGACFPVPVESKASERTGLAAGDLGHNRLSECDGRCVQDLGTYSRRRS
jgi:hypothetical protein